jgi:hypothetical protein
VKGVKGATGSPVPMGSTDDLLLFIVPLLEKFTNEGTIDDDDLHTLNVIISLLQTRTLTPSQENELDNLIYVLNQLLDVTTPSSPKSAPKTAAQIQEEALETKQDDADKLVQLQKDVQKAVINQQNVAPLEELSIDLKNQALLNELFQSVDNIFRRFIDLKITNDEKLEKLRDLLQVSQDMKNILPQILDNIRTIIKLKNQYKTEENFLRAAYLIIKTEVFKNNYLNPSTKRTTIDMRNMVNTHIYGNMPEEPPRPRTKLISTKKLVL